MKAWHGICTLCRAGTIKMWEGTDAPTECASCLAPLATLSVVEVEIAINTA